MLITTLEAERSAIESNETVECTVTVDTAAPVGGTTILLHTSNIALVVDSSVTILEGDTSATFNAVASSFDNVDTVYVSAVYQSQTVVKALTVIQSQLGGLSFAPYEVTGGSGTTVLTLNLNVPATAPGLTLTVSEERNDGSTVPVIPDLPTTITVPTGQQSYSVTLHTIDLEEDVILTVTVDAGWGYSEAFLTVRA
jgi:hypothetical protein